MEIIAKRLTELRKSGGLSQSKIGRMLNLPQGSVTRYEHNLTNPSPETLLLYADYFDVSMDYIFGRTDNPHGATFEQVQQYSPEVLTFIENCFEPGSNASKRLKRLLLDLMMEGGKDRE